MIAISVKNLSKNFEYYKKVPGLFGAFKSLFQREKLITEAVKSISFSVEEGELVGFLGPNGAGKTTTLKMLSGILYPSEGDAKVLDYTPWQRQKEYQKQFAIVMGQKNQLWWDLPAMESFSLNKEIYEVPNDQFKKTIDYFSNLLDISDILNVQVRKLSLGQRMKCELVAALLHNPKVLFLDEPTIGLDVVSQQKIREFIKKYNKERKTTILLTSHYMEDVVQLCQRVIIINKGGIIYDGDIQRLIDQYATHKIVTITFKNDIAVDQLTLLGEIVEFDKRRVVLKIPDQNVKENAVRILTAFPVDDILIDEIKVEEIIRHIFQTNK
ncbi:MAG: ABC transporter [Candidatus Kerfeldbacteria bacterium CG08_land_8_20_14_0_20_40_16]|uniref:ABC transporter n=1 Tax=Candidatus Kerfeldbacteria bacterium CG08_land_8_20_14_0_20_40_16 TaxID=2014244 RepID=A0A2H0YUE9_9BACT|nr:MAG: ABC transporter [Candidatus Kerfeldbacteria bacterium CG08_land_8_20_14_0_20_40_16]